MVIEPKKIAAAGAVTAGFPPTFLYVSRQVSTLRGVHLVEAGIQYRSGENPKQKEYVMKKIATLCLVTGLATLAMTVQAEEPDVVIFNQMSHVALGSAGLSVGPDDRYLRVINQGQAGGFRTVLPYGTTSWSALTFLKNSMSGNGLYARLSINPIAEGQRIAPFNAQWKPDGFKAQVEFTSTQDPVYEVRVFDSNDLISAWRCVPGDTCVPDDEPDPPSDGPRGGILVDFELPPEIDVDDPTLFVGFNQESGDCEFIVPMPATGRISIGDLELGSGNKVVITEKARSGQARYPYAFDAIDVKTSARQMFVPHEQAR